VRELDWVDNMASPIQIYETAHKRVDDYLGLKTKGRKPDDDLRAAVFFEVAAIDVYFHAKIIKHFREKLQKDGAFPLPPAARELIKSEVSKELTGSEYRDLEKNQQKLVDSATTSSTSLLLTFLEQSLKDRSFQSISDMSKAMEIMGKASQEVWGRFDSSTKLKIKKKRGVGRPEKLKVGKKIDAKVQLKSLFARRQLIAHEADIPLKGKAAGKPRGIKSKSVRTWVNASKDAIYRIDKLIV